MNFKRLSIGNYPSLLADTIVVDRAAGELVFASVIGYSTTVQTSLKELKTPNLHCYVPGAGNYRTSRSGYSIETKKDMNSDYLHGIFYVKDKINYKEDGTEEIDIYLYSTTSEELTDKLFAKIYKYSSVPVLEEWKGYLLEHLRGRNRLRELTVISKEERAPFSVHRAHFNKNDIKNIVQMGLQDGELKIMGSNRRSPVLETITGLNDYLANFGETLAEKIQSSFKPKFIPGEDKYDSYTNFVDDFMYHEADIELFEAQKSVIQATVNNLKVNDATFVIAEMGSGKTSMGAAIPYAHNANKYKGFNALVVCPSHLTIKWKREVEERIPNARAYIVNDFKELIELEPKLRNKNKVENSYIILSKERAKMSYDKRPAAIWSKSRNTFVCPDCGQALYTIEYEGSGRNRRRRHVSFNELSMSKQLASNTKCMNEVSKWNDAEKKYDIVPCNADLWAPLNRDDQEHAWFKLGSEGWIQKQHLIATTENLLNKTGKLNKKESALLKRLMEPYNEMLAGEEPTSTYKGPKKYSIAKYIRERMNGVFDYCLVDEAHQAKGLSEQGQAVADLISASKKSVLLTGTLLNGYADGLYYLLWRTVPHIMRKEGFSFEDEAEFARIYGVHSRERRYALGAGGQRERQVGSMKEKRLPGVSPLVFTKFLLENAVFLSLSDMSNGLPGYEEIPIPVGMDADLMSAYTDFENAFREYAAPRRGQSRKSMGPFLQALTAYPDCPHIISPITSTEDGSTIYMPRELPKEQRNKEERLLSLVQERLEAGEKVLVYYSFINKTDTGSSLLRMFEDNGITAFEMKSNVAPDKREDWVETHLNKGMQVMICNPSLVETGLDLLEFTSIIFYQMGYNLFTMRQASRRSWRLSQSKDVKVYFMYYQNSIQEQAISLMATKLQAAMAIEGKFSEEGLRAMSNNEDLLTQIANNVVEGIKDTVNEDIFKATAFVKSTECVNRPHPTLPNRLKLRFNSFGNKTIFSTPEIEKIPERKVIDINEELLNNPISLFI